MQVGESLTGPESGSPWTNSGAPEWAGGPEMVDTRYQDSRKSRQWLVQPHFPGSIPRPSGSGPRWGISILCTGLLGIYFTDVSRAWIGSWLCGYVFSLTVLIHEMAGLELRGPSQHAGILFVPTLVAGCIAACASLCDYLILSLSETDSRGV